MGWMQRLYETYEACQNNDNISDRDNLLPISHTTQLAHLELVLDDKGNLLKDRIKVLEKEEQQTLIPCTEASCNRTSKKPIHHPLADKLQYLAKDFRELGGTVTSGFIKQEGAPHSAYIQDLAKWANSEFSHPKVNAILSYLKKGSLTNDLIEVGCLRLTEFSQISINPSINIFKSPAKQNVGEIFIRWRVEIPGINSATTWDDQELIQAWINYYNSNQIKKGHCGISGQQDAILASYHPRKIRHSGDSTKLISDNDPDGYTFRGRFNTADEMIGISYDITQKAHSALRWLIQRQSYQHKEQVIVAWTKIGKKIPKPLNNFLANDDGLSSRFFNETEENGGDVGQHYSRLLAKSVSGYRELLDKEDNFIVMGLDSVGTGRLAITYYRELQSFDFLERLQSWYENFSWRQYRYDKNNKPHSQSFVGCPAPVDIARAAYAKKLKSKSSEKLLTATVERLLSCIIDKRPFPADLVATLFHQTANRLRFESDYKSNQSFDCQIDFDWQIEIKNEFEWNHCLGITCAIFRGSFKERNYQMSLEESRITRDYLYGRLFAIADYLERIALCIAGEKRDTNAARLMQRFSTKPFSTWKDIELHLQPYKSRLRAKRTPLLIKLEELSGEIFSKFQSEDFISDSALSGEFLLAYYCQRQDLWEKFGNAEDTSDQSTGDV